MDRASSLIFPGGRTLAGWWRQLSPHHPLALGVGYGYLHRIETPVNVLLEQPVEPLTHLVLQALPLEESAAPNHVRGISLSNLQDRLRLPSAVVQSLLAGLERDGLLARPGADRWQLTERGQHALERQSLPVHARQRRDFPFLERLDPVGQRIALPHFIPIAECVGVPWPVDEAHRFGIAELQGCIEQPPEWKQSFGFPNEVETLANGSTLDAWQNVIVDRPERVMLVLIVANVKGVKEVQGFAVKVDGWVLADRVPVLRLAASAGNVWPEFTHEPPMQVWQDAWRNWCKQRQLPTNEVEICSLTYHPPRLEVQAPNRLVQRLQAAKSDLFKGEAWLLVGDGYLRTAVQLTLRSNA